MICHDLKCIFIHLPRTAGTAIEVALTGRDVMDEEMSLEDDPDWMTNRDTLKFEKHIDWRVAKRNYAGYWDDYFKFGFVRRPYEFLASNYLAFYSPWSSYALNGLLRNASVFPDFMSFLLAVIDNGRMPLDPYYREDMSFYLHRSLGPELDFVGKYENLHDDYAEVCRRLNIDDPPPLPVKPVRDFGGILSDETIELIDGYWGEDFRQYKYQRVRSAKNKVSIVMPTFNGMGTIEIALDSIFQNTTYGNYELIVVDDGSTDGTERFVAEYMATRNKTNIQYVRLEKNYGICTALNVGFDMAGTNDVIRVDNDIEIITGDWIERFVETAYAEDRIGIVHCCPVLDNGDIHVFEIKTISADTMDPLYGSVKHDPAIHKKVYEIESTWLMCAFIKNGVVQACTNDEAYNPVWVEDLDYCLQARRAGFGIMCNQNIKVVHHHAIRDRTVMLARCQREDTNRNNRVYLQQKWWNMRIPVAGPGWKDDAGRGPDYSAIALKYGDCAEITKFLDPAYL